MPHSLVFICVFFCVLNPERGGFHLLAVAVSMLLAISCDVYHGRLKLVGAGAVGLSLHCMHLSSMSFLAWASPQCLV